MSTQCWCPSDDDDEPLIDHLLLTCSTLQRYGKLPTNTMNRFLTEEESETGTERGTEEEGDEDSDAAADVLNDDHMGVDTDDGLDAGMLIVSSVLICCAQYANEGKTNVISFYSLQ